MAGGGDNLASKIQRANKRLYFLECAGPAAFKFSETGSETLDLIFFS